MVERVTTNPREMDPTLLGEPPAAALSTGHLVDMVVHCSTVADSGATCRSLWTHDAYVVIHPDITPGTWTVYGFVFEAFKEGHGVLRPGEQAAVFFHQEPGRDAFLHFKEVCSGLGGITLGASRVGCRTSVFVDKSSLATDTILQNRGHAVQGDIADRAVRVALHMAGDAAPATLTAGFPCQSYSIQGSKGGLDDPRGLVLPQILQASWLLQSAALILECVAEVLHYPETLSLLQRYAAKAGFRFLHTVLDLKQQWGAKRRRWWCLMIPAKFPLDWLPCWPCSALFGTVGSIVKEWPLWPAEEERAIAWTDVEQQAFSSPEYGCTQRQLDCCQPAPTLVHSLGNALSACPCGCRVSAFSRLRLQSGGLRGFGIVSQKTGLLRHPHPREAGLLSTIPGDFIFPQDCRAALCLIGQVAAPLQALWVSVHLQIAADCFFHKHSDFDPLRELVVFQEALLAQRDDSWLVPSLTRSGSVALVFDEGPSQIKVAGPTTVADFTRAQQVFVEAGSKIEVLQQGRVLPADAWLHHADEASYQVQILPKQAALKLLPRQYQVAVLTDDGLLLRDFSAGVTISHAVRSVLDRSADAFDVVTGCRLDANRRLFGHFALDVRNRYWTPEDRAPDSDVALTWACSVLQPDSEVTLVAPALAQLCLHAAQLGLPPMAIYRCLPEWRRLLVLFECEGHWACLCVLPREMQCAGPCACHPRCRRSSGWDASVGC